MPRSYRYLHYDVFTDHLFGGNQLAVFLDGRGLADDTMQAIAKEMNFSETTFVLPPETPGTDVRMRIFTPGEEMPMAGHPTIGTTFALARAGVIERGRTHFVFGCNIGPVPVAMTWKEKLEPGGMFVEAGWSEMAGRGSTLTTAVVLMSPPPPLKIETS